MSQCDELGASGWDGRDTAASAAEREGVRIGNSLLQTINAVRPRRAEPGHAHSVGWPQRTFVPFYGLTLGAIRMEIRKSYQYTAVTQSDPAGPPFPIDIVWESARGEGMTEGVHVSREGLARQPLFFR